MAAPRKAKKEKERPVVTAAYINKCGVYENEIRQVCIRLLGARPLDAFKWSAKEKTEFFLVNIQKFADADLSQLDKELYTDATLIFLAQLQEYVGGVGDSLPKYPVTIEEDAPAGVAYTPEEVWEADDEEDESPDEEDIVDLTAALPTVPAARPEAAVATVTVSVNTEVEGVKKMALPTFSRPVKLGTPAPEPVKAEAPAPAAAPKPAAVVAKPATPPPAPPVEEFDPLFEEVSTLRDAVAGLTVTIEAQANLLRTQLDLITQINRTTIATSRAMLAMVNVTMVQPGQEIESIDAFLPEIP